LASETSRDTTLGSEGPDGLIDLAGRGDASCLVDEFVDGVAGVTVGFPDTAESVVVEAKASSGFLIGLGTDTGSMVTLSLLSENAPVAPALLELTFPPSATSIISGFFSGSLTATLGIAGVEDGSFEASRATSAAALTSAGTVSVG
jgi:hypothetical protein